MIQGICFDLDGVLVQTDNLHYLAWKGLADRLGIPFDRAQETAAGESPGWRAWKLCWSTPIISIPQRRRSGLPRKKNEAYRAMLARLSPSDLPADVLPTLRELRRRGYRLAHGLGQQERRADFGAHWAGEVSGCGSRRKMYHPLEARPGNLFDRRQDVGSPTPGMCRRGRRGGRYPGGPGGWNGHGRHRRFRPPLCRRL